MNTQEKEIIYTTSNSYSTLNTLTNDTKNIWFVCHGMGYLSRYFLRYFKGLNAQENYIIAPQAPSKYYIQPKMYVGANWLTKDKTQTGMQNILNYFDAVFKVESIPEHCNLIVLGYSQGVSVAMRYIAHRKLNCSQLVLHSGGIPNELKKEDFSHFTGKTTLIYGTKDEYLNQDRINQETKRAKSLFGKNIDIISFEGNHVVNTDIITHFKF